MKKDKIRVKFFIQSGILQLSVKVLLAFCMLNLVACKEDTIEPESFGSVFGEVLSEDNIAIQNATVSTNPPTSSILTDSLGRFAFENIKTGTYTIRAEKETFSTTIESVTVFRDQTSTVIIKLFPDTETNEAPLAPTSPVPALGSLNQSTALRLEWQASDPDEDDLTFEVHLFNDDQSMNRVVAGITDRFLDVEDLSYGTTYYWQVIATDGVADPVNSVVWNFRTENFPDHRFLYTKKVGNSYQIFSSNMAFEGYQLTNSAGSSFRPRMSPDRSRIAFISNEGINNHLFIMNRDGTGVTQVTAGIPIAGVSNFELDFAWSPDGTQLLYMNFDELYRINIDGTGLTKLTDAPPGFDFTEADWTASGNKIVARLTGDNPYNSLVNIYNNNGSFVQQLVSDDPGSIGGAMYSIDGSHVLYTYDESGFEAPDGRQLDSHIYLKNIATGAITDLSENKPNGTNDLDPRFSPDGSKVIFVNTNNDGISSRNIWIMTVEGEGRTMLFSNAEMPEWK